MTDSERTPEFQFALDVPRVTGTSPAILLGELLDVNEDDYNADETAVRKTWLDLIAKSPARLQAYRAGQIEPTEAMLFGQFLHAFVLEPDLVGGRFYREPEGNRATKAVKEQLAALAADNVGKIGVRAEKYDLAAKMRDALYAHRAARRLLEYDGYFERSIFWQNQDTNELCKAKYDKVTTRGPAPFIADIKTTVDASPIEFGKSIWNYRYDVQGSHYTEACPGTRFVTIAVERTPPFGVACYAATDAIIRKGHSRRLPDLRSYAECRARNVWPGYREDIQPMQLPRWAA